ncbi:MAG: UvrD-helicase domain-containing protein [Marmoricola sp.]
MRRLDSPEALQRAMGAAFPPSPQQWEAITAPLEPAVVVAGAGSGKTTLMAARVVYLVLTGQVRPEQVLGLTFTTKAASELRVRIRAALQAAGALPQARPGDDAEEVLEPTVATYHSYAAHLLEEHGLRIGHEPDTRVITDASRFQLGARAVERHTGEVRLLTDHPATAVQNLLALDGAMNEHLVDLDEVARFDARQRPAFVAALAAEQAGKGRTTWCRPVEAAISALDRRTELLGLVRTYRALKSDLGLMDFADQIAWGARLVEEQPVVGEIERDRFRVVLLDEYQDTSVAQARMLAALFSGPTPAQGRGHAVTAVGDPNQAIYGWRGASVSNILGFAASFPRADPAAPVRVLPLTVNRRSDRAILRVANALAAPLYDALPEVRPLVAPEDAAEGEIGAEVFETREDELGWLAEAVEAAHRPEEEVTWADIGVLVRDNASAEACFDALTARGVPVEIVGLSGLVRLPEVAEVIATLTLLHDVTDNTALLTLLTSARWAIGPRDLRLLARRAEELGGGGGRRSEEPELGAALRAVVEGVDPAELPALSDALEDPGEAAYSTAARERFALLAEELRSLRHTAGEPVLDVVRRIVDVTGVDVELASTPGPAAAARRDNLDLFLRAVSDFQALDGDVSLTALLAWLTAVDEEGNGLEVATPTEADSVKLLTVHRAKGLEWHTVFLVGVCHDRFPSTQSRALWTSSPAVLPAPLRGDAADLPQLEGSDKPALDAYRAATREHEATEERRLGYVAFTRAAHRLVVTSHCWGDRVRPLGPSAFQEVVRDDLVAGGAEVAWRDRPGKDDPRPVADITAVPWPPTGIGAEAARRREGAARVRAADPAGIDEGLDVLDAARVQDWDDEIDRLVAEARRASAPVVAVPVPGTLSATALARLHEDPEGFAAELARPMPRPPSPAARFGTRFHAWVEARFGQQLLWDVDDLPGRGDEGIEDDEELRAVVAAFERGPFADRVPCAVEAGFSLVLAGQVVRGRIDAVYDEPPGPEGARYLVVDWKTGARETTDPLQLAVYRQAWAELAGVPVSSVRAVFHHVRTGETVEPPALPGRDGLEALFGSADGADGAD